MGTFDGGDHLKYFRTQSTEQDCNSSQIRFMLSKSSAPEASNFLTVHNSDICHLSHVRVHNSDICHLSHVIVHNSDICHYSLVTCYSSQLRYMSIVTCYSPAQIYVCGNCVELWVHLLLQVCTWKYEQENIMQFTIL